jgi:penicillin-binding protein 1B
MERSLNVGTINLAAMVGLDRLMPAFLKFGFDSFPGIPSAVLGAVEVTPLQLAGAYTVFPNAGLRAEPLGIAAVLSSSGQRLERNSIKVDRVVSEATAFLVTYLLQGVIERGTASSARKLGLKGPLAGKTGTTDNYRDSWFVGYSPTLLTLVWVGFDDGMSTGLTGASGALQIWISFMREALRRTPQEDFSVPERITFVGIDPTRGCRSGGGEKFLEAFLEGTEPVRCP